MTTTEVTWTPVLDVFVAGLAAPQGSKRHVGRGVMIESSKAVKPWREDVRGACLAVWAAAAEGAALGPLDCPVSVEIEFVRKRPASTPKRRTPAATTAPDVDKLARAVLDAVGSAGVWVDDSRVIRLVATKRLAESGKVMRAGREE